MTVKHFSFKAFCSAAVAAVNALALLGIGLRGREQYSLGYEFTACSATNRYVFHTIWCTKKLSSINKAIRSRLSQVRGSLWKGIDSNSELLTNSVGVGYIEKTTIGQLSNQRGIAFHEQSQLKGCLV